MQFSVQDVRRWGNKKIIGCYPDLSMMKEAKLMLSDIKVSAYSFPKVYKDVHERIKVGYFGMVRFIEMCEPLLMSLDVVDSVIQRKVRNQWDTLWKNFGRDSGIAVEDVEVLKELGVHICFVTLPNTVVTQGILDFYNAVLAWYVLTSSEQSAVNHMDDLVLLDKDGFLGMLIGKE